MVQGYAAGSAHPGMVYCPPQTRSLGQTVRLLVLIWKLVESGERQSDVEELYARKCSYASPQGSERH
jgi:hypothetical protein